MLFSVGLTPRWCNKKAPADARFARMSFLSASWCLLHALRWKGHIGGTKSSSFFLEKKHDERHTKPPTWNWKQLVLIPSVYNAAAYFCGRRRNIVLVLYSKHAFFMCGLHISHKTELIRRKRRLSVCISHLRNTTNSIQILHHVNFIFICISPINPQFYTKHISVVSIWQDICRNMRVIWWDMMPRTLTELCQRFERTSCLILLP